jgi:lipopolysaccharide export system protein LptA
MIFVRMFCLMCERHARSICHLWRLAFSAVLTGIVLLGATAAQAQGSSVQGVPNAMQGFSQNRDKPIQIEAASLEMRDKDKVATFSGNVKVVQGDTTMRSKTLVVFYDNDQGKDGKKPAMKSASPGPGGSSSIRRLEAKGGVIVTQKEQTVTGETGIFDMKANTVTMLGGVVLTKDKNVLRGDRLVVDMTTGVSRVESSSGRGVQGMFQSSSQGGGSPMGGLLPGSDSGKGSKDNKDSDSKSKTTRPAGKPLKLNALPDNGRTRG